MTETERLQRDLDRACEWGACLWNTLDHGGKTPADFYDNYVSGSTDYALVDADTGERMERQ